MGSRKALGTVALALAAAVLAAGVLLLGSIRWTGLGVQIAPHTLAPSIAGPPHTVRQSTAVAPGALITVVAPVGSVTVATTRSSHRVSATARLYGGQRLSLRPAAAGGGLAITLQMPGASQQNCLMFCGLNLPGSPGSAGEGSHLWIRVPAGVQVDVRVAVGTLSVSGQYARFSADSQLGSITASHITAPVLSLTDQAGTLAVTDASAAQQLTLSAQAGTIRYQGTLGRTAVITDQAGSIRLQVEPLHLTDATVTVTARQLTSGFPGLSGGGFGTHQGQIGRGPPGGVLTVTAQVGAVTIGPWAGAPPG